MVCKINQFKFNSIECNISIRRTPNIKEIIRNVHKKLDFKWCKCLVDNLISTNENIKIKLFFFLIFIKQSWYL